MLKRIFGPERDEIIGGWRKLHKEFKNFTVQQTLLE
jgi:hypothetical protein